MFGEPPSLVEDPKERANRTAPIHQWVVDCNLTKLNSQHDEASAAPMRRVCRGVLRCYTVLIFSSRRSIVSMPFT